MSDKDKTGNQSDQSTEKPQSSTASEEKPDLNVKPPAYQYLTEGYDPDNVKKKPN